MTNVDQSTDAAAAAASAPYVQLFQKAHQKIVLLERLDEQFTQLIVKRQELQEELRDIQTQINDEFESRLSAVGNHVENPTARALSVTIGDAVKRNSGLGAVSHGNGNGGNGSARFAATAIEADER
jgi:hypothetical protein